MIKHSLSLCMIVRDEEETVGRAIKSALAVVDEVVVVDTGSTDNTRLIVEGYGARVIDYPWNDDFSAARNAGLAAAYGDWILVLDADEVLDSVRPVEMGGLLSNDEAIAYYVRIRDEVSGGQPTVYDKVRLFRNHPDIRYRYPIHEQITPAIVAVADRIGGAVLPSPLSVSHFGRTIEDEKGKRSRNQRLLSLAIGSYPEEAYFRYRLACEKAVYLEDRVLPVRGFGDMLDELENAVDLVAAMPGDHRRHLSYGPDLYARYATAMLAAHRPEAALVAVEEAMEIFGECSLLTFTHGVALLRSVQPGDEGAEARRQRAVRHMEAMLGAPRDVEAAPVSDAYFSLYPLRYLGEAALLAEAWDRARSFFTRALAIRPTYTGAMCGLARVADRTTGPKRALRIYLKALSIDEAELDAWLGGADVLVRLGFRDNARSWLQKLQMALPDHPDLDRVLRDLASDAQELVGQS
jgi:tetratricopeptide (TPR) repeat protein